MLGILILGTLCAYALINFEVITQYIGSLWFMFGFIMCLALIIFSLLVIFSKDVLEISKDDILLGYNVPFLHIDNKKNKKDKIQAVDIGHNPTTGRYYLTVISPDKTIIFGKNMPLSDLRWIRSFVIRETVKK